MSTMQSQYGEQTRDTGRNSSRGVRSAAHVESEAKESYDRLKNVLAAQPPWSREVEIHRTQTRNVYLSLIFGHPLSSHAQSLEPIWLYTTYSLIGAYRSIISRLEASLPSQGGARRKPTPQHAELKKVLTRFRQILMSEEQFYRGLVSRLVAFYQLQSLASESLAALSIGVANPVPGGGPDQGLAPPMSLEERRDKLGLVYKALICLGDLERYREQYSDPARREAREGKSSSSKLQERYAKASSYYDVARGLVPDDGSAFNQLAVISTYVFDNFSCVYFYFRALAVKHAFKNIDEILNKFLRKVYERWVDKVQRRRRGEGDGDGDSEEGRDAVEEVKSDLIVLVAILYRRNGLSSVLKLERIVTETLSEQVRARQVSAETVVRITAIVVGNYWHARQNAGLALQGGDPRLAQRRREAELASLRLLLGVYGSVLDVGADQVEEALKARANGSAVTLTDDDEPELHIHISAVLRRLLPSLRLFSKWLKLHLEHVSRVQHSGDLEKPIAVFWERYTRFVIALATLFPIDHLPSLDQPLEEDVDMRGYIPLAFGMDRQSTGGAVEAHDFHPNEEQLMRIADLQVDAKLLAQTSSGSRAMSPPTQPKRLPPFAHFGSREQGGVERPDDSLSVSTNTEDDPVNLAMRASLGGSSTDGDDEDEVIVWPARNARITSAPLQHAPTQPQALIPTAPTAQDLLQNLMLDNRTPSPHSGSPFNPHPQLQTQAQPLSRQPASGSGQNSPRMLFGADASGGSIWTMTRADSGRGSNRGSMQGPQGVTIASIWGTPESASPNPPPFQPPAHSLPQQWHRSSSSSGLGFHVQGQAYPAAPPPGFAPSPGGSGQGIWSSQGAQSGWPHQQPTGPGQQPQAHASQWTTNSAQYSR